MNLRNYFIFTSNYCNDLEFLAKLEYFILYDNVIKELNKKYIEKKNFEISLNLSSKISPLMSKLLDDFDVILSKEHYYIKYNIDDEKILFYDKIISSMNSKNFNYEKKKSQFVIIIQDLLDKVGYSNRIYKILYCMIIFKIIESNCGELVLQNFEKFKITVYKRLLVFQEDSNPEMANYMKNNYEVFKKYISKNRNKKYYLVKLKTILFSYYTFLSLYKKIRNKKEITYENKNCNIC